MKELKKLANAKHEASLAYRDGFDKFWETVKVLPDNRFFEIIDLYVREILTYRFRLGRTNGVKLAAKELFRKALCNEKGYSMDEMVRFAKTYQEIKSRLHTPLFELVEDKGDDSYSDLIDNLPLLGQKTFNSVEAKEYGNASLVRSTILQTALIQGKGFTAFREFVWDGENYNAMNLRDAAKKYVFLSLTSL
jgi:hypothetical protein